jgi:Protein of unknown function (DUF664)
MYEPTANDELTGIASYLDQQLGALRAAAIGLTDEQIRLRPCRSALSIGGLLKHATQGMTGATQRFASPSAEPGGFDEAVYTAYMAAFSVDDDESAQDVIAAFDAARVGYLAAVRGADPSAASVEPPAPWFGIYDARPANVRYYLVHQIEEMARHAGHADIIREEIDGTSVPAIQMSQEGMAANDFFQPYVPGPGTVGAGT